LVVLSDNDLYRGEEPAKFCLGVSGRRCRLRVVVEEVDGIEIDGGGRVEFTLEGPREHVLVFVGEVAEVGLDLLGVYRLFGCQGERCVFRFTG